LFGLVHLWIRIQFSPPFSWNYPIKVTRKRLKCLENAFLAISFSEFSGGGPMDFTPLALAGRHSADFNPVFSGKHARAPQIDFTPYAYAVRHTYTWVQEVGALAGKRWGQGFLRDALMGGQKH